MPGTGVLIVGVGGQGTLLASKILGDVAQRSGYDVKVSEVHGMAQRGGSVVTHVKFGQRVFSPLVGRGQADYLLAFEELEALRFALYLKKDGTIIANRQRILPMAVAQGHKAYPEKIPERLNVAVVVHFLEASVFAEKCGNIKATNMVLLGALASKLSMEKGLWLSAIKEAVPKPTVETNIKAFEKGFASGSKAQ